MFTKSLPIWFAMWLGIVVCEPPVPIPQYGVPFNPNGLPTQGGLPPQPLPPLKPPTDIGGPNYYNGNDIGGHGDHDHGQAMAYEFGYQVKDDYSGNNYGRQEKSDGNEVRGEYRVQLPDGRTQIVTYYADWQTGFHADVRYEGQPRYPDQYNINGVPNQLGGPRLDIDTGSNAGVAPGNRYGPPAIDVNQGGFSEVQGGSRYDGRNYDRGYNYNNGGGVGTGYTGVNDGINFDSSYDNYNNRHKPLPVYGSP
ncbi:Insect cuticle protein [Popillia japonica]|uniref:Insect cuticle protein n=1 Tax=Popillia japonica TaxID=7064 RepID=A0AAW1JWM3_POPJA